MKLFATCDAMNAIINNDTRENDFPSLHCNNFPYNVCYSVLGLSSGSRVHALLKRHFHPWVRCRDLIETYNFYVNAVLIWWLFNEIQGKQFLFPSSVTFEWRQACICTSRAMIKYLWKLSYFSIDNASVTKSLNSLKMNMRGIHLKGMRG
jgi:hypothetical protein